MKNRSFILKTDKEREKKLIAALRRRTGDRLTPEQLRQLALSVQPGRQYAVTLHSDPESFCGAMVLVKSEEDNDTGTVVFGHALFGFATETGYSEARLFALGAPACAIIGRNRLACSGRETQHQIHIYIPEPAYMRGAAHADRQEHKAAYRI